MAKTYSNMLPLGTTAPSFNLIDVTTNQYRSLDQLKSTSATIIMFICNHCPYVKHVQKKIVEVANHYQAKGMQFVAINSNDPVQYPDDDEEHMRDCALQYGYPFPYLYDQTQGVAKAYQAACTPDFFVFDEKLLCVYRGRFDASTPGNDIPVTGTDLINALEAILIGKPVPSDQTPSVGCNIKWR